MSYRTEWIIHILFALVFAAIMALVAFAEPIATK